MNHAKKALQIMGLAPLSIPEILRVTLEDAHAAILPYFENLPPCPSNGVTHWFRTPRGMKNGLLGTNLKTEKAAPIPCRVRALALAPANFAGGPTICSFSNKFCREGCIEGTGHYRFDYAKATRTARTLALLGEPLAFARMLVGALLAESHRAIKVGLPVFHRLNTLSDIPWEEFIPGLFDLFARWPVSFYDYSKVPGRITPANYHLTFSRSGTNDRHVKAEIARGSNIAVVFDVKARRARGLSDLPATWEGIEVINGDKHDVRALDPAGVIVGLKYKNSAGASISGAGSFVVLP
jgi:hypothetical protein